jgi:hypothetical protein
MVWEHNSHRVQKKTNIKNYYILGLIFILLSGIIPLDYTTGTIPYDSNLTILSVIATPDPVIEGNVVTIRVTIKNIGSQNISVGQEILITVKIDNEQTIATSLIDTRGLQKNKQRTENLTWIAELGPTHRRVLHVTLFYQGIEEAVAEGELRVYERKTDLLFFSPPSISGMATPGKPITITAVIQNIGKKTTQTINVSLKVDQTLTQWHMKSNGLLKGETYSITFIWTPLSLGVYTINLTIDPKKTITEELRSNNYYEAKTSVIPWWNSSWHYRRIYKIIGTGNISLPMNFSSVLSSLHVINKTFDRTSIRIIRYHTNGTMSLIDTYLFNESAGFDNRTNATGTLVWTVPDPSLYGVYFDVLENRGDRVFLPETMNLTHSGTLHSTVISNQGWWPEFITTFETYYKLDKMLYIQVSTTAQAKNLTAFFFWKNQFEFSMPFHTMNNLTWSNTTKKLTKRGDWTFQLIGYDDAGYQTPPLVAGFYIGQPDLNVTKLTAPTFCYVNYTVNITANICAVNATVQRVNVSLVVDNVIKDTKYDLTIQKNENRTVKFYWDPTPKGARNITVEVNYTDSNPVNNKKSQMVLVEGIPDLAVLNISVNPVPVKEGDPVAVKASIRNTGDGNATNYEINLYCEQNQNNHTMLYLDKKNSTTFNLKKNQYKNITLVWDETTYGKNKFSGEWAVGILIRNTTETPDLHGTNNYKALFHVLQVIPAERTPPVLSNLEYPVTQEQGNPVSIKVKVTDESGIASVLISIHTPIRTYVNKTMTPQENNRYEYVYSPSQKGRHTFFIKATDNSPSHNQSVITGSFDITGDLTPPAILFFGVHPNVQKPGELVEIRCLSTDFSGIRSVTLTLLSPDNHSETHSMSTNPPDTKYVYTRTYEVTGKYRFSVTVLDLMGNKQTTEEKTFWITSDLDDTDGDGIPDLWELRYGFNPYEPNDALLDPDNDGIVNLQEFQQGTNPLKEISSDQFIQRLHDNWLYLLASITVFVAIVILAFYGMWRRKP